VGRKDSKARKKVICHSAASQAASAIIGISAPKVPTRPTQMFHLCSSQANHPDLYPASSADLVQVLSNSLRFTTSGKPHPLASDLTARWAAEMLVRPLERSGFVVMQKPSA